MPFSWVSLPPLAEAEPYYCSNRREAKTMIKSTTQPILISWVDAYFLGVTVLLLTKLGARAGLGPVHWNFGQEGVPGMLSLQ